MADKTIFVFGKSGLPKTGHIGDTDGNYYLAGDDGYYQAGSKATPRFVNNGNGTVSDRVTGLIWVQQPQLIIPGATGVVSPSNQIQVAHGFWQAGHVYTAGDLVGVVGATIDSGAFTDFESNIAFDYTKEWTYNSLVGYTVFITEPGYEQDHLITGNLSTRINIGEDWNPLLDYPSMAYTIKAVTFYVCAVSHTSGGTSLAADLAAHPTWWRTTPWAGSCNRLTSSAFFYWTTGVDAAYNLEYAGFTDWRMPNILELQSLVNYGAGAPNPFSYSSFFPNANDSYWSSTGLVTDPAVKIYVDFSQAGTTAQDSLPGMHGVRPVRGGSWIIR